MKLIDCGLRAALMENARHQGHRDPAPLAKFFHPMGAATWLATELDADGDTLFGLADLGFGCPELGRFSLSAMESVRLPFGLGIERDLGFETRLALSCWAKAARDSGSILCAEQRLRKCEANQLPPGPDDQGGG